MTKVCLENLETPVHSSFIKLEGFDMRVFARREPQTLSLIAANPRAPEETFCSQPARSELKLRVVLPKRPRLSAGEIRRKLASLSQVDVMRVNWATIREGESHCIWPPDVIDKFSAADVITENSTSHYVLREINLTRIR